MIPIDLVSLLKPYKKGWVALTRNYRKVVTSDETLEGLDKRLKELGNPKVVVISASGSYKGFIS